MQKYSLVTKRTAHYYTLNQAEDCDTILLAIHGYAELGEEFIQNFKGLINGPIHVVCPEALSMFYGRERTPVSSWMTSQHREDEIKDYVNYLNQLAMSLEIKKFNKVKLLGFSQGVSTLLRWFWQSGIEAELHLCCGSIPPELQAKSSKSNVKQCFYYYGTEDRLMKENLKEKALQELKRLEIHHEYVQFEGRHEIPSICIENLQL